MFVDKVKPDRVQVYEDRLVGIHRDMKNVAGFRDATVIRPGDSTSTEYTTLIRFDCYDDLAAWRDSDRHKMWLSQHADLIEQTPHEQHEFWADKWVSRPSDHEVRKPAYWKKVILGIATVYPLILGVGFLLSPITSSLPYPLRLFLSVIGVSSLLTYPVMPYASKLLDGWLHPKR